MWNLISVVLIWLQVKCFYTRRHWANMDFLRFSVCLFCTTRSFRMGILCETKLDHWSVQYYFPLFFLFCNCIHWKSPKFGDFQPFYCSSTVGVCPYVNARRERCGLLFYKCSKRFKHIKQYSLLMYISHLMDI